MKAYTRIFIFIIALLHVSCEKVVDINLNDADVRLVIEGDITDQSTTQIVKISRTVSIGGPNFFPPVSNAVVTITDNANRVFPLSEQSPGVYVTTAFKGQPTRTYTLKVVVDGKEYTASSRMPSHVNIDFLKLSESTFLDRTFNSVNAFYIDPLFEINYYRFILYVNGVASKNIYIYTDEFESGKIAYKELRDFENNPVSGDLIDVELQCVDRAVYHYWDGLKGNLSNGGVLTIPSNPVSNISNNALGYFSAHTEHHKTIVVP
jgi:hypothetical protein